MSKQSGYPINEQRGIVLILSLLVMTVLSILGLAFLATARTENTVASNYRNHTQAFYAAEAGTESGGEVGDPALSLSNGCRRALVPRPSSDLSWQALTSFT